jgi:hypothetical protein|tara:strand:- start:263 stop:631 length:369 start_codon:yes stop_codon:yes gene_type:complete
MATAKKTTATKTKKVEVEPNKKPDARDSLDSGVSNEGSELSAIAVKSLTNLEEKVEAIDWKLWEIYNIVKNYVESTPVGVSAPQVQQPQPSTEDIAAEVAKQLQGNATPEPQKSVVGKLFGK